MPEANSHDHLDESSESHNGAIPTSNPPSQAIVNDENQNPGMQLGKPSRAELDDDTQDTDTDGDDLEEPAVLLEMVKLKPDEIDLFDAVASGDINTVNKLIEDMSFDTVQGLSMKYNEERDTLFHVTVRRQDEAMLEFLFFHVPNVDNILYDILLLAISESNVSIVHNILNEIDSNVKLKVERGLLSELPRWDNSQFPVHMTPMMLSGITGTYELITIFGSRGEVIEPTLKFQQRPPTSVTEKRRNCCGECFCCCMAEPLESSLFDHLAADYQRLNEYQAKASPEMLCYYANNSSHFDPILKSLEYINELNVIKMIEIEFRDEYEQIITKLKDFAVQLISKCENPLELDLLLSRREGYHGAHDKYPRVIMAIEMGFKEFVAHPHTQGTLYMEWAGDDWYEWRFLTVPEKFRQFIYRTLFLPLYLLFVCGEQGNNHGRLLASPLSRCIYSCVSQVIFIGLSMAEQTLELRQPRFRQPPNKYLEITLVIFVAGQIRLLVKHFFTAPKIFFKQAWNWYDCINYGLYCCCFACWGVLYLRDDHTDSDFFAKYQPAERLNWSYMDVFMVADCFLALGTVMASGKLLRYVQLNSTIGPIQVALGKMIKNISLFIPMFTIVFSSFALAITAIYAPYVTVAQENESKHALGTHMNTLYQMYWGLYGMTDTSSADMGTWLSKNGTQTDPYHYITAELAGKLLFSVYTLLGATILFSSMLVAYMVNTFGAIIEENEMNWKFSRAELWIYFSRSSVMPPPLNLLPTIWDIIHFFKTIREVGKDPHRYFLTCNCAVCLHSATRFSDKEKQQQEELYHDFVKTLIRRYFRYQADLESRALASAEETTTLSEDMEELQSMINNVLLRFGHPGGDGHHDGAGGSGGQGGQIQQNYSFTNRNIHNSSSVLDSKHARSQSRTGRLQRHSSTGVPGSGTVRDTPSSSKNVGENKSRKAPPSTRTTPSKEDNSKMLEGKPSVVQSAVLKYTQKLSSELATVQTPPEKSVRSTVKTGDDKSSGPPSSIKLDGNIPTPPTIPPSPPSYPDTMDVKKVFPKPILSSDKSIGDKSSSSKEKASQKPSHISISNVRKSFDTPRNDAIQKSDDARTAKQIPERRQSADKSQNYNVNETSEVMTKTNTWKTGTSNLEKPQLSTSSIPRKPPLPPLPSSSSSSADPVTSRSVKKKPAK